MLDTAPPVSVIQFSKHKMKRSTQNKITGFAILEEEILNSKYNLIGIAWLEVLHKKMNHAFQTMVH